ncbi:MAG: branched chain amino acid aminotransferase [Wenzhouxiangellaceae bacterium]
MSTPLRIAMWSGPRNISTAMMRAFENRADCAVSDEPLYGAWLKATGARHPMADQVIAAMECDWRRVVAQLTGPVPGAKPVWYQKHMTHHLLPEMMDSGWLTRLVHVFLIRHPVQVVASYLDRRGEVSAESIGVPQQWRLYRMVCEHIDPAPPVIDAGEFLRAPRAHLLALCARLGIAFDPAMLEWPPGPRDSDGVWAPHWYQRVWASTGFAPPDDRMPELHGVAREVAEACMPVYQRLYARRLRPSTGAVPDAANGAN